MKTTNFPTIARRLKGLHFGEKFTLVIGIAQGGIVPAYLVSRHLNLPLEFMWLNFRNNLHQPQREAPQLLKPLEFTWQNERILLVDDRVNSGSTLAVAKQLLSGAALVRTLTINGTADYSLFDGDCFAFPWDI